jgi:hypothetical protein
MTLKSYTGQEEIPESWPPWGMVIHGSEKENKREKCIISGFSSKPFAGSSLMF